MKRTSQITLLILLIAWFSTFGCGIDTDDDLIQAAEVSSAVDTGSDDTGSDDTGSDDTGSDDTGSDDTGSDDTGSDGTNDADDTDSNANDSDTANTSTDSGDDANDTSLDVQPDTSNEDTAPLCTPSIHPTPAPGGDPFIEVGTGVGEFIHVDNCDELDVVEGIQGGAHVWGSFRAGGFTDYVNISLTFEITQNDVLIASDVRQDTLRRTDAFAPADCPANQCSYEYTSVTVQLLEDIRPESIENMPAILSVRLVADGVELTDSYTFMPNCCIF